MPPASRTLPCLVTLALLLPPLAGGSDASPQITDPEGDIQVTAWPSVDVPEPSIDILSVTFGRSGDNLTVAIRVVNLSYTQPGAGPVQHKVLSTHFHSDQHHLVFVSASYGANRGWTAAIMCVDARFAVTCYEDLAPPTLDHAQSELRMSAPLSAFNGRVLGPGINSHVEYRNVPDAWPTLAFQDYAPNCQIVSCQGGADYDPYRDEA